MRGGGSGWSLCTSGWACHEIVWGITNGWRVSTAPARRSATILPSVPRWPPKPELEPRRRRGRRPKLRRGPRRRRERRPKLRRGRRRLRRAREPRLESVSWKSDCARIELNLCDLESRATRSDSSRGFQLVDDLDTDLQFLEPRRDRNRLLIT